MTVPPTNSYEISTSGAGIPNGWTKISFSIGEAPFILSDAILFRDDTMTPAEIDAEIQRRYDDWLAFVTAPVEVQGE